MSSGYVYSAESQHLQRGRGVGPGVLVGMGVAVGVGVGVGVSALTIGGVPAMADTSITVSMPTAQAARWRRDLDLM